MLKPIADFIRFSNMIKLLLPIITLLALVGCDSATDTDSSMETVAAIYNPAAEGFNEAGSDALAISIADSMVLAYGGREAYDKTRFFKWNFFGVRSLTWDKLEKRVRIDFPAKNAVFLLDYDDRTGRVQLNGEEVTEPDSLDKYMAEAEGMWINDSYWLVHQFKLKDSGVTLKYVDDTPVDPQASRPSYIIDQTFSEVGNTPGNRYRLYIDKETKKINTWQFFREATDEEASMETPWAGEKEFNGVLISTDRSGRFQLQDVSTPIDIADAVFEEF